MPDLTPERLAELRRIAEAATPGPWMISDDGPVDRFVIASTERDHIAETTQGGSWTDEDLENASHIATFDPTTVVALLDEIERLQREREVLADGIRSAIEVLIQEDVLGLNEQGEVVCEPRHYDNLCKVSEAFSLIDGKEGGVKA